MHLAFLISRLLDPLWVISAVTLLATIKSGFIFTLLVMVFMLGIPWILRFLYRRGDWDIKNRAHRPMAIAVLLVLGVLNVAIAWIFGNATMGKLFLFYELWLVGFFVISLFWKISGHTGGMALAGGLIIAWYGWAWWPVLLLTPLMGWARVVSKNHTVSQAIAGAFYSWILLAAYETGAGIL